ncbi:hypothetical protein FIBSPDRAFT_255376 [Athelia psychrophila]|uniref:MYND-type domain-containing protein n=1 Tax=Athelia psychrophila TaxID=1759441 RepID=A0A165XLA2_9AGAM|nr:hypothetical protein FIBSPDRAFT_255376 [Fibularhizoctonia sp. CBS 109695]
MQVLAERKGVYKSYSAFRKCSQSVLLCGNIECENAKNGLRRRCSACNVLLYCSRECQKRHWADHKALCDDMKGKAKGWVDMSYPNLHFLSYRVAYDMSVQHEAYISSTLTQNPSPAFYLNYVRLSNDLSNITRMDTKELADVTVGNRSSYPVSPEDMLQKAWHQLSAAPGEAIPVLVAIPRGANDSSQMMIATVVLSSSPETVGIRWFYCI